jgi:mRNA interferase MazF
VAWVDLDPVAGREQGGRRPFLVVAGHDFLEIIDSLVVGVPVTAVDRGWPNHVRLHGPAGLGRPGRAMTEQPRTVSRARLSSTSGTVTPATLGAVRQWLEDLLDFAPAGR